MRTLYACVNGVSEENGVKVTRPEGAVKAGSAVTAVPSRRERARTATAQEILTTARALLVASGPAAVTLRAIAREMGMTAPGLYRYVDGVEGLLTLLITEGFSDLAEALEAAGAEAPREDPGARFAALATTLRDWSRADVARFGLLFGSPLPGYAAPEDGPTTEAVRRAAGALWQVVIDAQEDGLLGTPLVTEVDPLSMALLEQKVDGQLPASLPPEVQAATWAAISLLLGSVSVEVFGHMPPCDEATAEALYRGKVQVALCIVGLPAPR